VPAGTVNVAEPLYVFANVYAGSVAVIEPDAVLSAELRAGACARTVNVYDVPPVNPVTVKGEDAPVAVKPPGVEIALKLVGVLPPAPAVNETTPDVLPLSVAETPVGTDGRSVIRVESLASDVESPDALVALILYT
jgi:hypothetical protein